MSNSRHPPSADQASPAPALPRAVIHKKILDAGAENPNVSMVALAEAVDGAFVDIVKKVLAEYGDPAVDQHDNTIDDQDHADQRTIQNDPDTTIASQPEMLSSDTDLKIGELNDKQRETLRAIANHPDATQTDFAGILGVSGATISNRVNAIPGFE